MHANIIVYGAPCTYSITHLINNILNQVPMYYIININTAIKINNDSNCFHLLKATGFL